MSKRVLGVILFIVLIALIIGIKVYNDNETEIESAIETIKEETLTDVTIAVGGGKEDFIADERVVEIMKTKYGINPIYDTWSNGKIIKDPLTRESDKSSYDLMFCSDQRFYDYYKLPADRSKGEASRYTVLNGGLTLNTPIVIYSWGDVTNALMNEGIVTQINDVYYITDMNKLLNYILEGKKWADIGLPMLYGNINIASTDPVTSSPGATYYGLLLSIMCGGYVTDSGVNENMPRLKQFYEKSGYMNNTPADLFEKYLKTGMGGAPMIVDYEKSIVEFATSNPSGFEQVKDDIRILYPTPTIWNSHCIATFTQEGNLYNNVFEDPEIQKIAWEKYGFRTGVSAGNYDVSSLGITGIPQTITSLVTSLKMDRYENLINYLSH
ncbi:MAG: hypothetical protein IKJ36_06335 [Clostridia bacterium]|nr:hypothetical protein [Clostridia bacterium]